MARTLPVLINRFGGAAAAFGGRLENEVRQAFAATGAAIDLQLLDGDEIADAARAHARAGVVVVGGGDGTMAAAASALARSHAALAILPLGTRNHFARQLGVPLDLTEAAKLAIGGQRRRIDLGQAGGRVFVNNASFGIYTRFVRKRDSGKGPKWLGTLPATWHVLRNMRAQHFPLRIDRERITLNTPLLFIANNPYSLERGHIGERESLTDGALAIYSVAARGPGQLIGFAVRALCGLARPERDFEHFLEAREVIIEGEGLIEGAFDGELDQLALPLRLRSLPNALGVVTPREVALASRTLSRTDSSPAHRD